MDSTVSTASTSSNLNRYVKLNVGGHFFQTTIGTLMSQEGMLKNMFKGDFENKKDSDGFVMIDGDGKYFSEILRFLRRGSISLSRPKNELENILAEAEFYQIDPLIRVLKKKLSSREETKFVPYNCYLVVNREYPPSLTNSLKPSINLVVGKNCTDPSLLEELSIFNDLCHQYRDLFEFVLVLDKDVTSFHWLIEGGGLEFYRRSSMKSRSAADCPIAKLLAKSLRKTKADKQLPK